jgi:hypothetical protein
MSTQLRPQQIPVSFFAPQPDTTMTWLKELEKENGRLKKVVADQANREVMKQGMETNAVSGRGRAGQHDPQ